ncbi:MAG TPA: hypothetical protein VLL98_03295 [Rickettsiales bacterium]|nr:hypothetical protein [Rickettsiales bacterium]
MKKITLIGANGKIGQKVLLLLPLLKLGKEQLEVVLLDIFDDNSYTRMSGFIKDLEGAFSIRNNMNIKFKITGDYKDTENSNLVVCMAGKWPTKEEKEKYKEKDPSGRLVQSIVNKDLITNIIKELSDYCPKCLLLITTNQVDIICSVANKINPDMNIIGLSGAVDSSRFKQIAKNEFNIDLQGLMIGLHNNMMFPLKESIISSNNVSDEIVEKITQRTRILGKEISDNQKTGIENLGINTGASILPAYSIFQLIEGYCFGKEYIESYNIKVRNKKIADFYNIPLNCNMSLPVEVSKNKIKISTKFNLSEEEKRKMFVLSKELKQMLFG